MKRFIILTMFVVALSGMLFTASAQSKQDTVTFQTNLRCDKCRVSIEDSLPFEKGVKDVVVDVAAKTVTVTYDAARNDTDTIRKALEKLGYTAELKEAKTAPEATGNVKARTSCTSGC